MHRLILILAAALAASGQNADPAYAPLEKAYQALRNRDYDRAIEGFEQALRLAPDRASIHTDLAYALLKIGESEAARDQFAEAMRLDRADERAALEYAFLCYETREPVLARRTFDWLRKAGNATAAEAFENIDRPLREGIARWTRVVEAEPDNFSAHEELARLAENRDESALAAEHYERAWRLRPDRRGLLLDLGRMWKAEGREADASAALLAASRGAEPRVAERARELLGPRYPYASEFQKALDLDPSNVELRRELGYLLLELGDRTQAEAQFSKVVEGAPGDLLSAAQLGFLRMSRGDSNGAKPLFDRVLAGDDEDLANRVRSSLGLPQRARPRSDRQTAPAEAKELGEKSLDKGYMRDALKYLQIAHENDPADFDVILKLGQTYNILKNDEEAVRWFNLARRSPDAHTAAAAARAYRNLAPALERFQTTFWAFPMFSTRWHDGFGYAQLKTEWRFHKWSARPYLSLRFIGDTRGAVELTGTIGPQYLSEHSAIAGLGIALGPWRGITEWVEAGEARHYGPAGAGVTAGSMTPDYRGGVSYARGFGGLLARGAHGLFAETNDDAMFVSRFSDDTLGYSQNRAGFTFRMAEATGGLHLQLYWNANATTDALGQYWANFVETGPGVKFRFEGWPSPVFSVTALRGAYIVNQGNPRRPNFNDVRVGVWYAFTH